ncbi:uncharacterized protein BX664DRAFT_334813 [Halteromyces radiatus]|uniref:uncharacterized protein n=1 Tax=Halteromyces radiatus TaxID=101107 RepID=UPI002220EF0F|nr:uncharacterized protein BX664DRAFT_334813 [Halteromyces radiatus]KAI8086058.1 hypothetical protein BX664DRAFT_334813 [Halteromyces radiatus]
MAKILRQAKCCHRCILRFFDCRNNSLYFYTEKELQLVFDHLLHQSSQSASPTCTACLGCFQYAGDDTTILQPICAKLKQEQYETDSFALVVTVPISMNHRDHLLKLHVQDQLDKQASKSKIETGLDRWKKFGIRDAKDLYRSITGRELERTSCLQYNPDSAFHIKLTLEHPATESEHLFLTQVKDPVLRVRKVKKKGMTHTIGDSRQNISEALNALTPEDAHALTTIPPTPPKERCILSNISMHHDSAYTGGRYLKLSRECSQTPWVVRGKKLADMSVSGCIMDVFKKYHRCDDLKFVTAGREDANVRMLGTGRPFYFEVVNPRHPILSTEECVQIEKEINTCSSSHVVQVRNIQQIKREDTQIIKQGEEFKRKTYQALVWFSEPLTQDILDRCNEKGSQEFVTAQNTPVRVFQRRGAAIREKTIHHLTLRKAEEVKDTHLGIVTMNTQAGTYIKEFVHGDLGRTLPNLATIAGVKAADLIELDVLEVDLEWPPSSHVV